jgi:CubicO group peptidase (beta-lactamase class C family)
MLNAANWTARLNELATEANVPGAALGIWSDGQEILAAHGVLNAATQVLVTTESVFQVGSITKLWTATMIMQLVDEGCCRWIRPSRRCCPARGSGRRMSAAR